MATRPVLQGLRYFMAISPGRLPVSVHGACHASSADYTVCTLRTLGTAVTLVAFVQAVTPGERRLTVAAFAPTFRGGSLVGFRFAAARRKSDEAHERGGAQRGGCQDCFHCLNLAAAPRLHV